MRFNSVYLASALVGASLLIAGCNSAQSPSMGGLPANSTTGAAQHIQNSTDGGCQDGNMRVSPCPITLSASNPGPVAVTVGRQGNHKAKITETDDCASSGVATVTRLGNRHYSVAAGSTAGSCTAQFNMRGGDGNGVSLPITNTL